MDHASEAEPSPPSAPRPSRPGANHTRRFLGAFYALAVVCGVRNLEPERPSLLDWLVPPAFAIALGWWAVADARRRNRPIPYLSRSWFFLYAGLLVPGYAIWSRGWRGVGWVVLHGVAWYVLSAATMYGTSALRLVAR